MFLKQKKSRFIIWMSIFTLILIASAIVFVGFNNNLNDQRTKNSLLVIIMGVLILIIGILGYKKGPVISDELSKTIQLEIYSNTHIAFLSFVSAFALTEIVFHFNLEPLIVINIIFSGTMILQLIISFFIKRKYR